MEKTASKYLSLIWLITLFIGFSSCSPKYYKKEKRGDMTAHWLRYSPSRYYKPFKNTQIKLPYTTTKQYYRQSNYKIKANSFTPVTAKPKIK